jgi:hypothetical protein
MKFQRKCILTVSDLRARCVIDPASQCWIWQGGTSRNTPSVYTLDYLRAEKTALPGPRAAWYIANQRPALPGWIMARGMKCHSLCMCPAHVRVYSSRTELRTAEGLSGRHKGIVSEARKASLRRAWAVGNGVTPPDVVAAIQAADATVQGRTLARLYGVSDSTVSNIRSGKLHKSSRPQALEAAL